LRDNAILRIVFAFYKVIVFIGLFIIYIFWTHLNFTWFCQHFFKHTYETCKIKAKWWRWWRAV